MRRGAVTMVGPRSPPGAISTRRLLAASSWRGLPLLTLVLAAGARTWT